MYGGSGKLGRGGGGVGRGGAKRFPLPPPSHRPIVPAGASSGRLSIGSGAARNRDSGSAPAAAATPPTREETFSLVSGGDPLAFAMIIRLAPNLVDEIRRVEAQGGTARIKFDSNANNPSGNVIDVGGKDFRFTWSHEPGDLCDIYEERHSGEDGNGLLVEAGGAWRKLNVQRILDESTKNHVKMRSEEAERKLKSRKAIVLDHGNPSVKNQMKTLAAAAVEMNTRRIPFKQKHEPAFKKRKVEPVQAGVAPKSAFKMGLSSATTSKGRLSVSPVPSASPPEHLAASASPIGIGNSMRSQTGAEEVIASQGTNKDENTIVEKEMPTRAVEATMPLGNKRSSGASSMDLQSMLINLLLENPKGMSLKALEKAIGDTVPNCAKKIDPIVKKIANFQAPGRYILRPGVELESLKKPPSESGSSPECARDQTSILEKVTVDELEEQSVLSPKPEESNQMEKIGMQQESPDPFCDKKASDHSDGHAASSSESGSDSDSESDSDSDSGSGSGSQSRSPAGSGSGSSSDSESDGSSSNNEGSDDDVDIMTSDDDKEEAKRKLQNSNPVPGFSVSPCTWRNDNQLEQNAFDENKRDGQVSVGDETAKDLRDGDHDIYIVDITDSAPSKATSRTLQDPSPFSLDHNNIGEQKQLSVGNFVDGRPDKREGSRLEPSDSSSKLSKPKSKMNSDQRGPYEKPESAKRTKTKEAIYSESPHYLSPDRSDQNLHKDHTLWMTDRVGKGGTGDSSLQRGYGLDMPGKPVSDAYQLGQRSGDIGARGSGSEMMERPRKYVENSVRGVKQSERSSSLMDEDGSTLRSTHAHEKFSTAKDKVSREIQDEDSNAYEKSLANNVRQVNVGEKLSVPFKPQYRKQGEQVGKYKDVGQMANSHMGPKLKEDSRTDADKSPVINGKVLRRELSDLELGELREPVRNEEAWGVKKKIEKKNSFRLSENKPISSDNLNSDSNKGRTAGKTVQDSRRKNSPDSLVGVPSNQEDSLRRRITEDDDDDESIMPQQRMMFTQAQQFSRLDHADSEVGSQLNKSAEVGIRARNNEAHRNQVIGLEGYGSTHKKAPANVSQQHEPRHEGRTVGLNSSKDGKALKSISVTEVNGRKRDIFGMQNTNNDPKRRESSSENDSCSYSKFEKDEPELKGPIKDMSQYKEYVQEYLEKYDSYCSLNGSLETYRNDFRKLGRDLQLAKDGDPDRYLSILEQLKENYRQCGKRHKRLKKIFIVLHEELQNLKQRMKEFAVTYEKD